MKEMKYIRLGYLEPGFSQPTFFNEYDVTRPSEAVQWIVPQLRHQHVFANSGGSGPKNDTYVSFRTYPFEIHEPRPRAEMTFSVVKVNQYNGAFKKFCRSLLCEEDEDVYETLDQSTPYAHVYNTAAGYPLVLPAPSIVFARFEVTGLVIRMVFDRKTMRGKIPTDANNDHMPDGVDVTMDQSMKTEFDCGEIFTPDSTALFGTNSQCTWKDDPNYDDLLQITLGFDSTLEVGFQIFIAPERVYTKPICYSPD